MSMSSSQYYVCITNSMPWIFINSTAFDNFAQEDELWLITVGSEPDYFEGNV